MTDRSEPTTAAGRAMVTVAAVDYYMDHWGVPTMKRTGIMQDLQEEAKVEAEARQPDSEALGLLRARIDAEPFFPKGDGPSIGNAAAFRDYKRRILAALPPSDPPEGYVLVNADLLAEALHQAMCDVSHHDQWSVCKNQRRYELIAASALAALKGPTR